MDNENKLLQGMLIGAAVGAVVSMFHKQTRQEVLEQGKCVTDRVKDYCQHPSKLSDDLKKKVDATKETVQEISEDLSFLNEKMNELKETTPQVIDMIQETKERFLPKKKAQAPCSAPTSIRRF
ncbi:YtxH domain-containing protein [Metabacillus herbersteinensis]|uniref:YtxH domain-containing protein n=1 Tax=Metabacillus herbersteinensis TaxID=283816 RepID=A0ABV6GH49_9BACI